MFEDDLIREVRSHRDAYAKQFDYDLKAIVADLQRLNQQGDWPVVRLTPRRPAAAASSLVAPAHGAQADAVEPKLRG